MFLSCRLAFPERVPGNDLPGSGNVGMNLGILEKEKPHEMLHRGTVPLRTAESGFRPTLSARRLDAIQGYTQRLRGALRLGLRAKRDHRSEDA